MSTKTKVKFVFERDTKGAIRFYEVDDQGNARKTDADGMVIGTLYLRKQAVSKLMGDAPQKFTVEITPG